MPLTDYLKLIDYLKNVMHLEEQLENNGYISNNSYWINPNATISLPNDDVKHPAISVVIGSGCGYGGFVCVWYFDPDGKFLDHGVWE